MGFLARRRFRRGRAYAAASSSGAGPPASDRASVPPRPNVAYLRRPSSDEDRLPTIFAALGIALVKDREQDGRSAAFTTSCSRRSGRFGLPARAFSNRARGSRAPRGSPKRPCSAAGLRAKARARSARRPSNGWRSLGGESRRRRGCTVDIPWKRFAATSRGDAAAATWMDRGDGVGRRHKCAKDIPIDSLPVVSVGGGCNRGIHQAALSAKIKFCSCLAGCAVETSRGDAAAARDIPWRRVAAAPRPRRDLYTGHNQVFRELLGVR